MCPTSIVCHVTRYLTILNLMFGPAEDARFVSFAWGGVLGGSPEMVCAAIDTTALSRSNYKRKLLSRNFKNMANYK